MASTMKYKDAIAESIAQEMENDPNIVVLGVGVCDEKGIFGTTKLAHDLFPGRVWETPLSENMLTGAIWGMALNGYKPILVHARADFLMLTMEHLVNTAAKWKITHHTSLVETPTIIIRAIIGKGWGQGPQHSQAFLGMLARIPGVHAFAPITPGDAKDSLALALRMEGVSVILEHRSLFDKEDEDFIYEQPENPVVDLVGISGAAIETIAAGKLLNKMGLPARVSLWGLEFIMNGLDIESDKIVLVDVENNGIAIDISHAFLQKLPGEIMTTIVSPPPWPLPTSQALEPIWYPSHYDVIQAACKLLGLEQAQGEEPSTPGVAHPKDGPF